MEPGFDVSTPDPYLRPWPFGYLWHKVELGWQILQWYLKSMPHFIYHRGKNAVSTQSFCHNQIFSMGENLENVPTRAVRTAPDIVRLFVVLQTSPLPDLSSVMWMYDLAGPKMPFLSSVRGESFLKSSMTYNLTYHYPSMSYSYGIPSSTRTNAEES
ncbi:hypothetical protein TNCV_2709471 [Trichonephila clavipes]|nr:hypothetical protein TNCV_2709471 [Trichonephila clavipes]